jgi:DNA repair protein RecN (Recombination protein N)
MAEHGLMLERLLIKDLALVERAEIPFGPGLNALTGETGAGKTLVVQAMNLVVGERADQDAIRTGAASAVIEAEFRLQGESAERVARLLGEWGLESGHETLVVRREVAAGGRSRASVNQSPVTLASLKKLGELLADLHGQHEHQSLLRPDAGLLTLDRLARLEPERARYADALAAWREAESELARLQASLASLTERADYLRHAARELDEAALREDEDETLTRDAARLAHADRLRALVGVAVERLSEAEPSALSSLSAATHALEQAAALDSSLEESLPALREAEIAASEAARSLAGYLGRLEADPEALETIEARRDRIARITRKYRRSVAELLRWREELATELTTGEDAEGTLAHATEKVESARAVWQAAGAVLSRKRRAAAAQWGPKLTRELEPLGLGRATLELAVEPAAEDGPGPLGLDRVALRFAPNPGEPARPLQRIASGGELSRVMLALKSALDRGDRVDLLVFDEVDSGIGGVVAQAVGERLRRLARHRQIVCVTHLPMIAALAQHHLRVTKQVAQGRTTVRIEPVEAEQRVAELARMLAGERITDTTRRQARELLGGPAR